MFFEIFDMFEVWFGFVLLLYGGFDILEFMVFVGWFDDRFVWWCCILVVILFIVCWWEEDGCLKDNEDECCKSWSWEKVELLWRLVNLVDWYVGGRFGGYVWSIEFVEFVECSFWVFMVGDVFLLYGNL